MLYNLDPVVADPARMTFAWVRSCHGMTTVLNHPGNKALHQKNQNSEVRNHK